MGESAELINRRNAGMLKPAADPGLFDEAAKELRLVAVAFELVFDGRIAAEIEVASPHRRDSPGRAPVSRSGSIIAQTGDSRTAARP